MTYSTYDSKQNHGFKEVYAYERMVLDLDSYGYFLPAHMMTNLRELPGLELPKDAEYKKKLEKAEVPPRWGGYINPAYLNSDETHDLSSHVESTKEPDFDDMTLDGVLLSVLRDRRSGGGGGGDGGSNRLQPNDV